MAHVWFLKTLNGPSAHLVPYPPPLRRGRSVSVVCDSVVATPTALASLRQRFRTNKTNRNVVPTTVARTRTRFERIMLSSRYVTVYEWKRCENTIYKHGRSITRTRALGKPFLRTPLLAAVAPVNGAPQSETIKF